MAAINSNLPTLLQTHFIGDVIPLIYSYLDDTQLQEMVAADSLDWNRINQARVKEYPFLETCLACAQMTGERAEDFARAKKIAACWLNQAIEKGIDPESMSCQELQELADKTDSAARLKFAKLYAWNPNNQKLLFSDQSTDAELEQWLQEKLADPTSMDSRELVFAGLHLNHIPFSVILSPTIDPQHLKNLFFSACSHGQPIELFKQNPQWKLIEQDPAEYPKVMKAAAENALRAANLHNIQALINWSEPSFIPNDLLHCLNRKAQEIVDREALDLATRQTLKALGIPEELINERAALI
jgi:hypothetical protein